MSIRGLGAEAFNAGVPREASRSLSATTANDWVAGWDSAWNHRLFMDSARERAKFRDPFDVWCEQTLAKQHRRWWVW